MNPDEQTQDVNGNDLPWCEHVNWCLGEMTLRPKPPRANGEYLVTPGQYALAKQKISAAEYNVLPAAFQKCYHQKKLLVCNMCDNYVQPVNTNTCEGPLFSHVGSDGLVKPDHLEYYHVTSYIRHYAVCHNNPPSEEPQLKQEQQVKQEQHVKQEPQVMQEGAQRQKVDIRRILAELKPSLNVSEQRQVERLVEKYCLQKKSASNSSSHSSSLNNKLITVRPSVC